MSRDVVLLLAGAAASGVIGAIVGLLWALLRVGSRPGGTGPGGDLSPELAAARADHEQDAAVGRRQDEGR